MSETTNTIRDYILSNFFSGKAEDFQDDTPLLSSGVIDSISALQLVEFLEEKFKFEFEAHEVDQENLDSLDIIVKFIEKKTSLA